MIPDEIQQVFQTVINPALAEHGGVAYPLSYEDRVVTIRMGGACRGCLAQDTTVNRIIKKELKQRCRLHPVDDVYISDDVDPELWQMVQDILKGDTIP